jgi:hypothetical protein
MERVNCDVIQDLLPLYVDDVCSESSKKMIEDHLTSCTFCTERLEELHIEDIPLQLKKEKINSFKKLALKLKLRKMFLIIISIISTLIIVTVAYKIYNQYAWGHDVVISYDKVKVMDVCQLSDGRIAFHTVVDDGYRVNGLSWHEEYPYPQISFWRGEIKNKNIKYSYNDCYWVFSSDLGKITYVGENQSENVIWKKGDVIPKASKIIEEKLSIMGNGAIKNISN